MTRFSASDIAAGIRRVEQRTVSEREAVAFARVFSAAEYISSYDIVDHPAPELEDAVDRDDAMSRGIADIERDLRIIMDENGYALDEVGVPLPVSDTVWLGRKASHVLSMTMVVLDGLLELKRTNSTASAFSFGYFVMYLKDMILTRHDATTHRWIMDRFRGEQVRNKKRSESIALAAYDEIRMAKPNGQRSEWEEHAAKEAGVSSRQVRRYLRERHEDRLENGSASRGPS
jgi:hypothetical protein